MKFWVVFVSIVVIATLSVAVFVFHILTNPQDFPNEECEMGWGCMDYYHKAFRSWDCEWSTITECSDGCENGECLITAPTTCSQSWKCTSVDTKGYLNTDCSWTNITYCPNGCEEGECEIIISGGSGNGGGSGGGGNEGTEQEPGFWEDKTPEDFIRDSLSIKLLANKTGPCERDSAIAETPAQCSDNYILYQTENCKAFLYIYGFQNEECAKTVFDIDNIDGSSFADFPGNVYLMQINNQKLVKTVQDYPNSTNYGYIWQVNRFVFTMEGNNDIYLIENLGWIVSQYSSSDLTLYLIEILK